MSLRSFRQIIDRVLFCIFSSHSRIERRTSLEQAGGPPGHVCEEQPSRAALGVLPGGVSVFHLVLCTGKLAGTTPGRWLTGGFPVHIFSSLPI